MQICFLRKENGYKQNLLEDLFYDNPSILKFWHVVTFLSSHYLPIYSAVFLTQIISRQQKNADVKVV